MLDINKIFDAAKITEIFFEAKKHCDNIPNEQFKQLFQNDELQETALALFPALNRFFTDAEQSYATDQQKSKADLVRAAIYAKMLSLIEPYFYNSLEYMINQGAPYHFFIQDVARKKNNYKDSLKHKLIIQLEGGSSFELPLNSEKLKSIVMYLAKILPVFGCEKISLDETGLDATSADYLAQIACHTLSMENNRLGDKGLVTLLKNTAYKTINVTHCDITNDSAASIASSSITTAHLSYNNITTDGAKVLAKNTSIQELYLAGNPIGEEGILALAKKPDLRVLDLRDILLSKRAIEAIANHPTLTTLSIGTTGLTNEDENDYIDAMTDRKNEAAAIYADIYKFSQEGIDTFLIALQHNYSLTKINIAYETRRPVKQSKVNEILKRNQRIQLGETRDAIVAAYKKSLNCKDIADIQEMLAAIKTAKEEIKYSLYALTNEITDTAKTIEIELDHQFKKCDDLMKNKIHSTFDDIYFSTSQDNTHTIPFLMECFKILISDTGTLLTDFSDEAFAQRFDDILIKTFLANVPQEMFTELFDKTLANLLIEKSNRVSFDKLQEKLEPSHRLILLSHTIANWNPPKNEDTYYLALILNMSEQMAIVNVNLEKINAIFRPLVSLEKKYPQLISRLRDALMNDDSLQLNLNGLNLMDDDIIHILDIVSTFPNYKAANISFSALETNSLYSLQNALYLSENNIGIATIKMLANNSIFSTLELENTGLTDDLVSLLITNPMFRTLILVNNQITNKGANLLAQSPHLRHVDLRANKITSDAIEFFRLPYFSICNFKLDKILTENNKKAFLDLLTYNFFILEIDEFKEKYEAMHIRARESQLCQWDGAPNYSADPIMKIKPLLERNNELKLAETINLANDILNSKKPTTYTLRELNTVKEQIENAFTVINDTLKNTKHTDNENRNILLQLSTIFRKLDIFIQRAFPPTLITQGLLASSTPHNKTADKKTLSLSS